MGEFFYLLGEYDCGQAVKVFWKKRGGGSQLSFEVVISHRHLFSTYEDSDRIGIGAHLWNQKAVLGGKW